MVSLLLNRSLIYVAYGVCTLFYIISAEDSNLTAPGLPVENITVDEFLETYHVYNKYTVSQRSFNLTTLAYVTPWNKLGYKTAELFSSKFDLISPVWFDVQGVKKGFTVTGIPDIDTEWVTKIRLGNAKTKIVPRFNFAPWTDEDYLNTFDDIYKADRCIGNILKVLKDYNFDGAVIEVWSRFAGLLLQPLVNLIIRLSGDLHEANKLVILVVPAPVYFGGVPGRFGRTNFEELVDHIDFFSLLTYDYSLPQRPGPTSPVDWIDDCIRMLVPNGDIDQDIKRAKILVGLNFYGMDYLPKRFESQSIKGDAFVSMVETYRPNFTWHETWAEHSISFLDSTNREHLTFYPTLMSIARRLSTIAHRGSGLAIWEIGQGLDSFYSLF